MKEREFQKELIKEIKDRYPGCIVMKLDSNYIQGIPDLAVLYKNKWAALECKIDKHSSHQPNQDYYIEKMNAMSFASFVDEGNKGVVLNELDLFMNS